MSRRLTLFVGAEDGDHGVVEHRALCAGRNRVRSRVFDGEDA
jgi:hypothetical protein